MLVNADFTRRAVVAPADHVWVASPQAGVERVMLDRLGGENARATSLVRYAPGSHFPAHAHPGGEEILVLEGTFSEGGQHFPAGWYLRNPPGSGHAPSSAIGALLFVKLRQMAADERDAVRVDTRQASAWRWEAGREICPLFAGVAEQVSLQRLPPHTPLFAAPVAGAEVLVLDGAIDAAGQRWERGTWIRLPPGRHAALAAAEQGTTIYLKTGHLAAATKEEHGCAAQASPSSARD
ncbi:anti-ECFsigma factor, ChrR [Pseudoduganella flava]|uniref:Anti-ECFsigma factor, ChrR n=1 Tax=Pseudoduganella flava TaxID=871742 RepID=A0A562Q0Z1_9BURK|nr:cupin domain-containing protein [Pseudoduganella flava]QGZ38123.1 anti-sigma factor [Pseudoduganella flava]TWI50361.1 anti-ECFsigma factor, ChrR [Pseudoduganella flava]